LNVRRYEPRFAQIPAAALFALLASNARASLTLGAAGGVANGVDNVDSGVYSAFNIGYEFSQTPTRFAVEGQVGGHVFAYEQDDDDTLTIGFITVGGRVTHYFNGTDKGPFGYLGAQVGFASTHAEFDWGHDLDSDAEFAAQGVVGLGYAINQHWRISAEYRYFHIDETKDDHRVVLEEEEFNTVGLAFDYVF